MNKPVAWMMKANDLDNDKDWLCFGRLPTRDEKVSHQAIPLYTHPVEITDEEILQQAEWMFGTHFFECIDDPYWIEFAKAILRKAQEK